MLFTKIKNLTSKISLPKIKKIVPILFLAFLIGWYLYSHKSLFVVARVNNTFVFRSQLNKDLADRYGAQTLDDLVTITLVRTELAKQKIAISDSEINGKITQIEASLSGIKLEDALKAQNMTLPVLKEQIKLQLGLEKAVESKIEITEEEIKTFLVTNSATLTAKDDEGKRQEATNSLRDQKLQQAINDWVTSLQSTAKIEKYL